MVERKGREYARDEGARTSRKKGITRIPKSSNWTVYVSNASSKWANEIISTTTAATNAATATPAQPTTTICHVAASNDASFDPSNTYISATV